MGRTLAQKIWDAHVVRSAAGEPDLLYIDLHLVHEVTSPQAFDGLRLAGRSVRRPDLTVATEDHNVPTTGVTGPDLPLRGPGSPVTDPVSQVQVEALRKNCAEFGITLHPMGDPGQGIVHVIGPQQGLTLPGMTIVCGDSHTSTHGAFGALAFGIGTSEVEHVLATQTLPQARPASMAVTVTGRLEDLRAAAGVLRGRSVAAGVRMLVVPGSMEVKAAAEREGLAEVFTAAGAEWRSAGCSMCLGMNADKMAPGERSASTSNRNFEGRQGKGARTHLVSPQVAAATAVTGRLTAPADL